MNDNRFENDLSTALRHLADGSPAYDHDLRRAPRGARAARIRMRGPIIIAAAAASMALVIGVPVALINNRDGGANPSSGPRPLESPATISCPIPGARGTDGGVQPRSKAVAPGAAAIRLCSADGPVFQPPSDVLVQGVDRMVDAINKLPIQEPQQPCPLDLAPTWGLLFTYEDNTTQYVTGTSAGCGGVMVGSSTLGDRAGATLVLDQFLELLKEQRVGRTPPDIKPISLACDAGVSESPGEPQGAQSLFSDFPVPEFVAARLCWTVDADDKGPAAPWTGSSIKTSDLEAVAADMRSNETTNQPGSCASGDSKPRLRIVASTVWGDRHVIDSACGYFILKDGHDQRYWEPVQAAAIFDRMLDASSVQER